MRNSRGLGTTASLLVLAIISLVVIAALMAFVLQVGVALDSDTRGFCVLGTEGGGAFPDPPTPDDRNKKGEIISRGAVIHLPWTDTGQSIPFTVSGSVIDCEPIVQGIRKSHRYVFDINNGDGWESMSQDDFPEGFIQVPYEFSTVRAGGPRLVLSAREVQLDGISFENGDGKEEQIHDGAVLRVRLFMGTLQASGFGGCCDWYQIAWDEARLVYATPSVERTADIFEVGQVGSFRWSLPFTELDGQTAYYMTLTYLGTNAVLSGWDNEPLMARTGMATFNVTTDLFQLGKVNRVRAEIFSPIFRADIEDVATIDDVNLAPTITKLKFNQREFREGDAVVITMEAAPNPTTRSPVTGFYVLAHIGGLSVYDQFTASSTVQFPAPRAGVLEAEVTAQDEAGRTSAVSEIKATVGNVIVDCEVHPELPKCGGSGLGNILGLALAIILIVAGLLLFVFGKEIHIVLFIIGIFVAGAGFLLLAFALIDLVTKAVPFI